MKIMRIKQCVCKPCSEATPTGIPTDHPVTTEQPDNGSGSLGSGEGSGNESSGSINPDEITNNGHTNGGRKKRSLANFFYDLFIGEN